jgi:lipooligosaccharide transport system permease protein
VLRGSVYAAFFLVVMVGLGLASSPWVVLALPAATLLCWAFAAVGAAGAAYMRTYFDFDLVNLALIPSFLFSGTFFPLARYPDWLATVVRCTPLYQGVDLLRGLAFGDLRPVLLVHVAYLVALGVAGTWIAGRRLATLLTP